MKLNTRKAPVGAVGYVKSTAEAMLELRRTVACCLLWEDGFYESGESTAARIRRLVALCPYSFVFNVAVEAREVHGLRHVPLLLARELARHPGLASASVNGRLKDLLPRICTRADQLSEFVALFWATNDGKKTLPAQVKKGLAAAFSRFDAFALAKNDHGSAAVALRDVAFLSHPKDAKNAPGYIGPVYFKDRIYKNKEGAVLGRGFLARSQGSTLDLLCEGKLPTPDTWETQLSAAGNDVEKKRAVFARLLAENKLGGLAWLRNLRKMADVGIPHDFILEYGPRLAMQGKLKGILPFQFMTAARHCPWARSALQPLLLGACEGTPILPGHTLVLVDVSGSMQCMLGSRENMKPSEGQPNRLDGALGVAMFAAEVCETSSFWSFSNGLVSVSLSGGSRGFELADLIRASQPHSATYMRAAVTTLNNRVISRGGYDRILVITDEQSSDGALPDPIGLGYVMNVGTDAKTVAGRDKWTSISGWGPAVLGYVAAVEGLEA